MCGGAAAGPVWGEEGGAGVRGERVPGADAVPDREDPLLALRPLLGPVGSFEGQIPQIHFSGEDCVKGGCSHR